MPYHRAHLHLLFNPVSKIANKRRAKKIQAPYRRYVYRLDYINKRGSDDEDEEEVEDDNLKPSNGLASSSISKRDIYGGNTALFKAGANVTSTYVLTGGNKKSQWGSGFQKIDVLLMALKQNTIEDDEMEDDSEDLEDLSPELGLMSLPVEILVRILEILQCKGHLRPKHLVINRLFFSIVFPMIYNTPHLKATNFYLFVDTINNNKKAGEHIVQLDLLRVIQSGKNAYVSKLLKRSRKLLQLFVAPQTSFGYAPLLSLKHCEHLKILDLRLVSETLDLDELFRLIKLLQRLTHLSFPRSSVAINDEACGQLEWPPQLSFLRLSGGISDSFLMGTNFPESITQLEFAHCPAIREDGFQQMLRQMGLNLRLLRVQYPMPLFKEKLIDCVFDMCPNLLSLEIAVDYISSEFFDEENLGYMDRPRPLKALYIEASGMLGTSTRIDPIDLAVALNDERLPHLKNIRCTAKLGWDPNSEYVSYIATEMDERGGGIYIGY